MAGTLATNKTLREDGVFLDRLAAACAVTAVAIIAEAANTANHAERYAWARKALNDPRGYGAEFTVWAVVSTAAISAKSDNESTISDQEIKDAVAAVLTNLVAPITVETPKVPG